MTSHFLYLIICSTRNSLKRQLKRMRSPRYAIAAIFGLLYFFTMFGGWLPADRGGAQLGSMWLGFGRAAGPLLIAIVASRWWLWPSPHQGLRFLPSETHLLLPAPITRRQLITYKVLQVQPAIILSALIASFFTRGTELMWPLRMLSVWVLLATLHQHQIAASLVQSSAQQHGRSGLRTYLVPLAVFGVAFGVLLLAILSAVGDIRANPSLEFALSRSLAMLQEPGPTIVLTPFRFLLAPLLASGTAGWLPAFGGALLVLLLHYLWVLRTDAAFEEAAAERGAHIARLRDAVRAGGLSRVQLMLRKRNARLPAPWLPLHPTGHHAYAIFWKNVLQVQRSFRLSSVVRFAVIGAIFGFIASMDGSGDLVRAVGAMLISLTAMISAFGPFVIRNDLRSDLAHIDLLRTYPLRGTHLVGAGIAAATACLTAFQLITLSLGLTMLAVDGALGTGTALLIALCAPVVLPVVNALAVLIQNALALLYPTWVKPGTGGGGVEVMGQTIVIMVASLLLLALFAIPPLIVGGVVGAPLAMLFGGGGAVAGAVAAFVAAGGEIVLVTMWLGGLFDRTDPVAAGLLR